MSQRTLQYLSSPPLLTDSCVSIDRERLIGGVNPPAIVSCHVQLEAPLASIPPIVIIVHPLIAVCANGSLTKVKVLHSGIMQGVLTCHHQSPTLRNPCCCIHVLS